jgi:hypothetical protein
LRRFNELGNLKDRPGRGAKKKLNETETRLLVNKVKGKPRASTRKTSKTFKTKKGMRIGRETIRVTLKHEGLYPHKRQKSPRLTAKQKTKRIEFAKNNRRRNWNLGVFWDEKEFELFGPPNRKDEIIWDDHGVQYSHGEVAHPSKFKIGGAISSRGATRLVPYEGTIDSNEYQNMIATVLPDINKMYPKNDWFLVQDSAKPHSSKSSQSLLADNVPSLILPHEWPANSPDISAIENIFGDQQDKVYQKNPETLSELKRIVKSEWKKLTPEICSHFVSAVPKRLKKIAANGGEYIQ